MGAPVSVLSPEAPLKEPPSKSQRLNSYASPHFPAQVVPAFVLHCHMPAEYCHPKCPPLHDSESYPLPLPRNHPVHAADAVK